MEGATLRDEYRVCQSLTTGLFYFARFLGDKVHPDHNPTWQEPHSSYLMAYRAAMIHAKIEGVGISGSPIEFKTWPDIFTPRPQPKKQKGKKK